MYHLGASYGYFELRPVGKTFSSLCQSPDPLIGTQAQHCPSPLEAKGSPSNDGGALACLASQLQKNSTPIRD